MFERFGIVEEQIAQYQKQPDWLFDFYLDNSFQKGVLTERKSHLDDLLFNLGKEQDELLAHVRHVTITDDQLN